MTTGNVLYLLMSIGGFVLLSVVLAYQSWQQSRVGSDLAPEAESGRHHAIAA
jgi:hypothetical protein